MKFLPFLFFIASLCFCEDLSFSRDEKNINKKVYTIQLFSYADKEMLREAFEKIPAEFKTYTNLYNVKGAIKGRCFEANSPEDLAAYLKKVQNAGFKDAFIVKTTVLDMQNEIISGKKETPPIKTVDNKFDKKEDAAAKLPDNENIKTEPKKDLSLPPAAKTSIGESQKTEILYKAHSAYLSGNEGEAITYYEMLLSVDDENEKIKNNLCYLYGKQGAWLYAKELIEAQKYQGKFIYAYAYGAIERNDPNFYNDLSAYIAIDHSGKLMILAGYYFEKQNDMEKANRYYETAYERNPQNVYNIFAYARSLDIKRDLKAAELYRSILSRINSSHPIYALVKKRVGELEG